MAKPKLKDLVIVLPGITGSVLKKDGKEIWSTNKGAIWRGITNWSDTIESITVKGNDDGQLDLDDGIYPGGLVQDCHLIPGLIKLDGYNRLIEMLKSSFDVVEGTLESSEAANFFEFAYDWRRDNRVTAARLKTFIDKALPRWIEYTGNKEAKVILIAHSMGGLISRYYLEVLDGWKNCKTLYTLGTPFHGALGALEYLCNGYKLAMFDISEMSRSCKSAYQLLPNYKAVNHADSDFHVSEIPNLPKLNAAYVSDSKSFHAEIDSAQERNLQNEAYRAHSYKLSPLVGAGQETLQSALFKDGKLTTSFNLPGKLDAIFAEGDGTVPRISAIPEEFRNSGLESYIVERHGSLQTNTRVLDELRRRIEQSQVREGLGTLRGGQEQLGTQKGLALSIDDAYQQNTPFTIGARLLSQTDKELKPAEIKCTVTCVETDTRIFEDKKTTQSATAFEIASGLPAGVYRVRIEPTVIEGSSPTPVTDLIGVC